MKLDELERLAKAATPGPWLNKGGGKIAQPSHTLTIGPDLHQTYRAESVIGVGWNENNASYLTACFPERILAMIAVIRAADAMRKDSPHISDKLLRPYDAARAKLEGL